MVETSARATHPDSHANIGVRPERLRGGRAGRYGADARRGRYTGPGGSRSVAGPGPACAPADSAGASERGLRPRDPGRPVRSSYPSGDPALAGGSGGAVDGLLGRHRCPALACGGRSARIFFADKRSRGPTPTSPPWSRPSPVRHRRPMLRLQLKPPSGATRDPVPLESASQSLRRREPLNYRRRSSLTGISSGRNGSSPMATPRSPSGR